MRPLLELRRTGGDRPQYPVGREDLISDASFLQKATLSGQGRILLPLRLEELLNHLCRPSHCHRRNSKVYPTLHDLRCPLHLLHLLRAVPGPDHLESQQSRRACSPDRESRLWRILGRPHLPALPSVGGPTMTSTSRSKFPLATVVGYESLSRG